MQPLVQLPAVAEGAPREPPSASGPALQQQPQGARGAPQPATFLDKAVQLIREETQRTVVSRKQEEALPGAGGSVGVLQAYRQQQPAAALLNGGGSSALAQTPRGGAAQPGNAGQPAVRGSGSGGPRLSPIALHPVSYHQPPPSAAASVPKRSPGRASRSPAEQLGLRAVAPSGAAAPAAAEVTPVGQAALEPAWQQQHQQGAAVGASGSKSSLFSPDGPDEEALAQIDQLVAAQQKVRVLALGLSLLSCLWGSCPSVPWSM